jgi:hypothetical protein
LSFVFTLIIILIILKHIKLCKKEIKTNIINQNELMKNLMNEIKILIFYNLNSNLEINLFISEFKIILLYIISFFKNCIYFIIIIIAFLKII